MLSKIGCVNKITFLSSALTRSSDQCDTTVILTKKNLRMYKRNERFKKRGLNVEVGSLISSER